MPRETTRPERLVLARMPFLSAREKILLDDILDGRFDPSEHSKLGLEEIVGRRLKDAPWEPQAWKNAARQDHEFFITHGITACSWFDELYPPILRETSRAPYMLYVRGTMPILGGTALAIVGTRFPTGRGLETAWRIAGEASAEGLVVVSGLARGIDTAAHRGAMGGGRPTCAVLGCGIDGVYPKSNRDVAAAMIAKGGCLVSEYPPGTNPSRWTFPERNRIIAGFCRSTLVIEAPLGSGALITASFALEEGRDVFVAQAGAGGSKSAGSDKLVSEGARLVTGFCDISSDWCVRETPQKEEYTV